MTILLTDTFSFSFSVLYTNKSNSASGMLISDRLTVHTKAYADYCAKKFADQTKGF